ncbi:glycosyltransferase family 4 protein [Flavobacterium undicola]|uniref:glycosyltransferase family 4 protein n=1 Tax=Flavobacterium undicola TaxID=1932779 RepID=UPI0013776CC2|nr:glycosyltransferase family 4 protein [Flavobacterium undicola]MBA0884375.1 glycosyltransferase family 4 protein [Flavobacterium undicola]
MKNILFITHSGKAGGAQNVLSFVINNTFEDKEYKRYVIYPKFQGLEFVKLLNTDIYAESVFYRSNSSNTFKSIVCNIINIPGLIYLVLFCYLNKIKVIYINSTVNFIGIVLSFLTPTKVIWHVHEQPNEKVKIIPNYFRKVYKKLFLSKKINSIFVSNYSVKSWEKTLSIKISKANIVYPPVRTPVTVSKQLDKNEFCFGFLGALVREKNILTLLEAFDEILKRNLGEIKLIIAGEGILRNEIIEKVIELNISDKIELLEYNSDVSLFFSKIDVLVQPSYNESWGLVALEALSYSKAVIMTRETGLREILVDGKDCLFIDPLKKSDLMEKMIFLLDNKTECLNLGHNGYKKFKSFEFNDTFSNSIKNICDYEKNNK